MIYSLFLIMIVDGNYLEQEQPYFHSFDTCMVALAQAKQDTTVISATCREVK